MTATQNCPVPAADELSPVVPASTWLSRLETRSPPHFNQLVIWILLGTAAILACTLFNVRTGESSGVVSLLFWIPDHIVAQAWMFALYRVILAVGIGAWLLQRWLPWSCWLTVIGFTGLWSLHVETTYNTAHIFHMANMLLVIQAIWITADAPLIRRRIKEGTFWSEPLVPRWVSLASIVYIGTFHSAAGFSKLLYSGPGWANGTSLQLWTYLWGYPWSPATWLILNSRTFAKFLQALTLCFECAGLLAIIPALRPWIGLGLLAFYAGVLATFSYGFQFNALLTAAYLLPCERWINGAMGRKG